MSVLGNRNLNAVSKQKFEKANEPRSRISVSSESCFLRLVIKINYDQGRGPLTVGPRFLEPAEHPIATPLDLYLLRV